MKELSQKSATRPYQPPINQQSAYGRSNFLVSSNRLQNPTNSATSVPSRTIQKLVFIEFTCASFFFLNKITSFFSLFFFFIKFSNFSFSFFFLLFILLVSYFFYFCFLCFFFLLFFSREFRKRKKNLQREVIEIEEKGCN